MIITDNLVLNGTGSTTIVDKNKWFLKYGPPKMENVQCDTHNFN